MTTTDGLRTGKNVLYAVATDTGTQVQTMKVRFEQSETPSLIRARAVTGSQSLLGTSDQSLPTNSNFLPPSVALTTLTPGGANGPNPWIQIGSLLPLSSGNCGGIYTVIVLDRQTLAQKTDSPISSPQCLATGSDVAAYLGTLDSTSLVIVGTNWQHSLDYKLNTSAIGGTDYSIDPWMIPELNNPSTLVPAPSAPLGYIAIGVGGAAPGVAYENFSSHMSAASPGYTVDPFANGMLVEDVNGNYNFQALNSGPYEYAVSPNDSTYSNTSNIRIASMNTSGAKSWNVYSPSPASDGSGGFWVLTLQSAQMKETSGCASGAPLVSLPAGYTAYPNCGTFYNTGSPNWTTATSALSAFQNALSSSPSQLLTFITTVGQPFPLPSNNTTFPITNITKSFLYTLAAYGAPYNTIQYLIPSSSSTPVSTFSLVSTYDTQLNLTNNIPLGPNDVDFTKAINGGAVSSTSLFGSTANGGLSNQSQTGYIRGVLLPNNHGLYAPSLSSQDTVENVASTSGMDYTLHEAFSLAPSDWPEYVSKLPNADTLPGQMSAYHWLSNDLLSNHYMPGIVSDDNNQYDIHYYFTGGLNTLLNFYNYNPAQEVWPGTGTSFQWTDPILQKQATFTQNDFNATKQQLSTEILYLTNTLTFMVSGSANMKDLVAGGQSSAALALTSAASNIFASTLSPPENQPTTINTSNILNFMGAFVSIAGEVATGLLIDEEEQKALYGAVETFTGILSGALWEGGSVGFVNPGQQQSRSDIPNANRNFLTTIGQLAQGQLQGQLGLNFDTSLDLLLSDWNKLAIVGPKVSDTTSGGWYLRRQVVQTTTVGILSTAAERSFYLSLLPSYYFVDEWVDANAWLYSLPSQGYWSGGYSGTCEEFYPWRSMPADSYVSLPLVGSSSGSYDQYIMGGVVEHPGNTGSYSDPLVSGALATYLFEPAGLNLPKYSFLALNGPLTPRAGPSFTGFGTSVTNGLICTNVSNPNGVQGSDPGNPSVVTTTMLTGPSAAALHAAVTFSATTKADSGSTAGKTVVFFDGTTALGKATVDSSGNATLTIATLALGSHSITANLTAAPPMQSSVSAVVATTIYDSAPDFAFALSADAVTVQSGSTSQPVTLTLAQNNGFTGAVKLSCSGLPIGMTCSFNPSSVMVAKGGETSTLTFTGGGTQASSLADKPGKLGLLTLAFCLMWSAPLCRKARKSLALLSVLFLFIAPVALMTGCSDGTTAPTANPIKETGLRTVLVVATSGGVSHTVPIALTVQ
ncbi:MAG: Ig-like domain-containing protein [Edaphobacter sp.]